MTGEETPDKVQEANDARWQEYGILTRMERKLQKKILENPGKRPPSPEPTFHAALPGSHPKKGGERTALAEPRTGEHAGAGWRTDQSAQRCKTKGRQTRGADGRWQRRGEKAPRSEQHQAKFLPTKLRHIIRTLRTEEQETEDPLKKNLHRREQDQPRGSPYKREGQKEGSGTSSRAESKN